jgi:hypothetical protein
MTTLQLRILAIIALAIGAFFLFDIDQWLTLERFKAEWLFDQLIDNCLG